MPINTGNGIPFVRTSGAGIVSGAPDRAIQDALSFRPDIDRLAACSLVAKSRTGVQVVSSSFCFCVRGDFLPRIRGITLNRVGSPCSIAQAKSI